MNIALLIFTVVVLGVAAVTVVLSALLGQGRANYHKNMPFESGMAPTGDARIRMAIPYYIPAIMFILFDVEILFLYPYAVVVRDLGWMGLLKAGVFLMFVFAGLVYVWLRGGLIWRHLSRAASAKTSSLRS